MAFRDKMRRRCQPFLEPGEEIRYVLWCQTGPSPWLMFLITVLIFLFKYRIVCVTDRAVVVLRSSRWYAKPIEVLARLPRPTVFGTMNGMWGRSMVNGERLYIHRRFHKDVAAADAEVTMQGYGVPIAATPAGWYPDPHQEGRQRWFDGTAWTEHVS